MAFALAFVRTFVQRVMKKFAISGGARGNEKKQQISKHESVLYLIDEKEMKRKVSENMRRIKNNGKGRACYTFALEQKFFVDIWIPCTLEA